MAKLLVELKMGSLLDLVGGQYILSGKPQLAMSSNLVDSSIARGDMKLLATLKDDANEEALNEAIKKKDIKGFIKKYKEGAEEEEKKPEEKKPEEKKPEEKKPEEKKPEGEKKSSGNKSND